jgi:Bacterial toxin 23
MQLGTHSKNIGLQIGGQLGNKNVAALASISGIYNYQHLGAPGQWWQAKANVGGGFGLGAANKVYENNFMARTSLVALAQNFRAAYLYHFYRDTRGTSQNTGTIKLAYKNIELISENDAFAFLSFDRYKTGGIALRYINDSLAIGIKTVLWTGYSNKATKLSTEDGRTYVDIANAPLGKFSHGILALEVAYAQNYNQYASAQIGIDDESVRDFFQNKIVHAFINAKKQTTVPQLDAQLHNRIKPSQKKRMMRFYGQVGMGGLEFY